MQNAWEREKSCGQFEALLVACVKSHHARPSVSHDTTIHRQLEVIQTDGSTCQHNISFLLSDKNAYKKHESMNKKYEGCSLYNETVLITFTFYRIRRLKDYEHKDQIIL